MPLRLYTPGDLIEVPFPGDEGVRVKLIAPDKNQGDELYRLMCDKETNLKNALVPARKMLGIALHSIDGVIVGQNGSEPETYAPERSGSGGITDKSWEFLAPIALKLVEMIGENLLVVTRAEAKNS